jgi:hypothetical protein
LVEGDLEASRIDRVLAYAEELTDDPPWTNELALSRDGQIDRAVSDMGHRNMLSVTDGRVDVRGLGDINAWLNPYSGDAADSRLAARYRELGGLRQGTLGRAFFDFYDFHHFAFPGESEAVNEMFATPHDLTHVLSGYDTTPQGELLVSTFTSRMHPVFPMEGHVLPVIYSWHLGIEINSLAGHYRGALDAAKFWIAWDRGKASKADPFDIAFDFWSLTEAPLDQIQHEFGIRPLEPAHAAHSSAVAGVDYHPIA